MQCYGTLTLRVTFHFMNAIRMLIELIDDEAMERRTRAQGKNNEVHEIMETVHSLRQKEDGLKTSKLHMYEDYVEGRISREEYIERKEKTDIELKSISDALANKEATASSIDNAPKSDADTLVADCFREQERLTNEMALAFTDSIYIHSDGSVEIKWKFSDVYENSVIDRHDNTTNMEHSKKME